MKMGKYINYILILYLKMDSIYANRNRNQFININSPKNTIRSNSSNSKTHHPKIKIPKNSKLSNFFVVQNCKNELIVEGKLLNLNSCRSQKAISLKSLEFSSLGKKLKQSSRLQCSKQFFSKQQEQSIEKDPSQTRSRLTILQDYGLVPEKKAQKKHRLPLPKTPRYIRSKSGNKKIIFPIKPPKPQQKQPKLKESKTSSNLQYTFGLQGFSFAKK